MTRIAVLSDIHGKWWDYVMPPYRLNAHIPL